jgi:hypothetical protein
MEKMREDNLRREKFAEELLDAALSNHRGAEPVDGLEDRVLANMRQQSRAARPVTWNPAPAMIAAVIVLALFAGAHLIRRPPASNTAIAAVSRADEPRGAGAFYLAARQVKAEEGGVVADGVKLAKAFAVAPSASRRRDLALNLNSRRAEKRSESGLQVEEVRIAEIRLDDIVIGANERQE